MRRIDVAQSAADVLHGLLESSVSGVVEQSDDAFAAIKSFQSSFRQISRTPEMVRLMLQAEFNFAGVVDASAMTEAEADRALQSDWWDCTFVVVDYANVENWLARCVRETYEGRTAVALVPSRTNANWFHELVLEAAEQVRFVKGRVHFPADRGAPRVTGFPDALVVYRGFQRKRVRNQGEIAVLACARSFTDASGVAFEGGLGREKKTV
jgi:hypothetical protein